MINNMGNYLTSNWRNAPPEESSGDEDFYAPPARRAPELCPYSLDAFPPITKRKLTPSDIAYIEHDLDFNEKVSLVFLLYDDARKALEIATRLENGEDIGIFQNVVVERSANSKIFEALAIVQNYQILNRFGYTPHETQIQFLPHRGTSIEIDLTKKKLYRTCEDLTNQQLHNLLKLVRTDFIAKNLEFKTFRSNLLEMYLLHWFTIQYITTTDYSSLSKIFKQIDWLELADYLGAIANNNNSRSRDRQLDTTRAEEPDSLSVSSGSIGNQSLRSTTIPVYPMHKETPGVCLIINQEMFYTEPNPALRPLVPNTQTLLETRQGTHLDRDRIQQTMSGFGFKVIVENNLDHGDVLEAVKRAVKEVRTEDCSLFVYILSHGIEGKVYGTNSIPVNVSDIKKLMSQTNMKHLCNKPKILIIQACQGTECETVPADLNDIEMDGPSTVIQPMPQSANMFVFWATVPGFGAIRDKRKGTWFVQSLCQKFEEHHEEHHFEEICTSVVQDLTHRLWGNKTMVPIKESTLTANLYFPSFRTGFST